MATQFIEQKDLLQIPFRKISENNESYASRLVNFVERKRIDGVDYTKFYTELDTNLKVGDKVHIVNGNYDTYEIIKQYPYRHGADGYEVLEIDRTGLVLDIEWSGQDVWDEDSIDDFIKIHIAENQVELAYEKYQTAYYPFKYHYGFRGNNNILFDSLNNEFLVYDSIGSTWSNVSSGIMSNSMPTLNGQNFTQNNGIIKIIGGSFTYNGTEFKEDRFYRFENGEWVEDKFHNPSYLSKGNFRKGSFKGGTLNDAIFGSIDYVENWYGAEWRNGILYNSNWLTGKMQSKSDSIPRQNYYSVREEDNTIKQNTDFTNNQGFGYNLIAYSILNNINIDNANIENVILGTTFSGTQSIIDQFYQNNGNVITNNNIVNARILDSNVKWANINNGQFDYSDFRYCKINDGISTDSKIEDSVWIGGEFDGGSIDILDYDRIILSGDVEYENPYSTASFGTQSRRIVINHKFYISNEQFEKIKKGDSIYLRDVVNNLNNFESLFDESFYLGGGVYADPIGATLSIQDNYEGSYFIESVDTSFNTGLFAEGSFNAFNNKISVQLKTAKQNEELRYLPAGNQIPNYDIKQNQNGYPSIDIQLIINNERLSTVPNLGSNSLLDEVNNNELLSIEALDISNSSLQRSNFLRGHFENGIWKSSKVNNVDHIIDRDGSNNLNMSISLTSSNYVINLDLLSTKLGEGIIGTTSYEINESSIDTDPLYDIGDVIYLDKVEYSEGTYSWDLSGKYLISTFSNRNSGVLLGTTYSFRKNISMTLEEYPGQNILNNGFSYSLSGSFNETLGTPNFTSIHKEIITNSTINEGSFKRGFFLESTLENDNIDLDIDFINSEIDSGNVNQLKLINYLICCKSNLTFNGAFVYKSFIANNDIDEAVISDSSLQNVEFGNGILNSVKFKDSVFNSGLFLNTGKIYLSSNTLINSSISGTYSRWAYSDINSQFEDSIFRNGIFFNSLFFGGTFSNGNMFNSNFYYGDWVNGEFGDIRYSNQDSTFGYYKQSGTPSQNVSNWHYGIFTNGIFGPDLNSPNILTSSKPIEVTWNNGIFNGGVVSGIDSPGFTASKGTQVSTIWEDGVFNNGLIRNQVIWNNGIFNGGKFESTWPGTGTQSDNSRNGFDFNVTGTTYSGYAWKDGTFNNGFFGSETIHPSWETGIFNDGEFIGKVWNDGILSGGKFIGMTQNAFTHSAVAEPEFFTMNFSDLSQVDQNWFGLWRKGQVTGNIKELRVTPSFKKIQEIDLFKNKQRIDIELQNVLWVDGEFKASNGVMENSVWLNGTFSSGTFRNSNFNPYVPRWDYDVIGGSSSSSNPGIYQHNLDDSCYWKGGTLDNSEFSISTWENGRFLIGTMSSGLFKNGVANYMNAYNVIWENGRWRNGNWYGANNNIIDFFNEDPILTGGSQPGRVWTGKSSGDMDGIIKQMRRHNETSIFFWNLFNISFEYNYINIWNDGFGGTLSVPTNNNYFDVNAYVGGLLTDPPIISTLPASNVNFNGYDAFGYDTQAIGVVAEVPFGVTPPFGLTMGVTVNDSLVLGKFGNGAFLNGIWENGVWNNGPRTQNAFGQSQSQTVIFDSIGQYYQLTKKTWQIILRGPAGLGNIEPGDDVGVGNIVGIDINGERKLIKDRFKVVNTDEENGLLYINLTIEFPLRSIEKDSDDHKIYVTKNVWLSGLFLNGIFEGVWNNGYVKGYPCITSFTNSHWIDGTFDGGHFHAKYATQSWRFEDNYFSSGDVGFLSSATAAPFTTGETVTVLQDSDGSPPPPTNASYDGVTTVTGVDIFNGNFAIKIDKPFGDSSPVEPGLIYGATYSSGLIQNMEFYENADLDSVSLGFKDSELPSPGNEPKKAFSWIDVTWNEFFDTRTSIVWSLNADDFNEGIQNTNDVLSSQSVFRYNNINRRFNLGIKLKTYDDLIDDNLDFIIPSGSNNAGSGALEDRGWIFWRDILPQGPGSLIGTLWNIMPYTQSVFYADNDAIYGPDNSGNPTSSEAKYTISHKGIINVQRFRYYEISFEVIETNDQGYVEFYPPANYGSASTMFPGYTAPLSSATSSLGVYKKYVWNPFGGSGLTQSVDTSAIITLGGTSSFFGGIDNITFKEVDYIPFHKYWSNVGEDGIREINCEPQIPYTAVAPFIDYEDSDFDFVGNITFEFDASSTEIPEETIPAVGLAPSGIFIPSASLTGSP